MVKSYILFITEPPMPKNITNIAYKMLKIRGIVIFDNLKTIRNNE